MIPIRILPAAWTEFEEITEEYRAIRPNLRDRFIESFEASLSRIGEFPEAAPRALQDSRRASMKDFPYHIYYKLKPDHIIIWSVFHESRDVQRLAQREKHY